MLSYEGGVLIAFLLWLTHGVMLIVAINSTLERNLNKIGQRLSWATGTPVPLEQRDLQRSTLMKVLRYLFVMAIGLPFIFASWLYIFGYVGMFLYRKSKDAGAPQAIREFRWKLRNVDMPFDEVAREFMRATGVEEIDFESCRAQMIADLKERGVFRT